MKGLFQILILLSVSNLWSQYTEIPIGNPSFEGSPAAGTYEKNFYLSSWFDCAPYYFKGQTPPDVQPGTMEFFDVTTLPQEGNTYLGMVTRQNETWELVSQRLTEPLQKGSCYTFDLYLSRSDSYFSRLLNDRDTTKELNFNKPIVLRIWGGRNVYEKRELLAESPLITHTEWRNYEFEFHVKNEHDYLILEAFYKTPTLLPYNGNVLLDNVSNVRQISCPGEEPLVASIQPELPDNKVRPRKRNKKVHKNSGNSNSSIKKQSKKTESPPVKDPDVVHNPRILKQLDSNKIREGQIIKIEQLYFEADSSNFTQESYHVLNEIFNFLISNRSVVIEIGGHTNGIPGKQYCQSLSLKRAKAVAGYLYEKGIPKGRIVHKGYGKEKPIASNKTNIGRQKNQRVEIKILKIS